jgi:hypothetical protein
MGRNVVIGVSQAAYGSFFFGRTHNKHIVRSGCGDLKASLRILLAPCFFEIQLVGHIETVSSGKSRKQGAGSRNE